MELTTPRHCVCRSMQTFALVLICSQSLSLPYYCAYRTIQVRIRRIYFSERLFPEEELPPEFKLFQPAVRICNVRNPITNKAIRSADLLARIPLKAAQFCTLLYRQRHDLVSAAPALLATSYALRS